MKLVVEILARVSALVDRDRFEEVVVAIERRRGEILGERSLGYVGDWLMGGEVSADPAEPYRRDLDSEYVECPDCGKRLLPCSIIKHRRKACPKTYVDDRALAALAQEGLGI